MSTDQQRENYAHSNQVAVDIIDQAWLEEGYSQKELEQSKQLADLLDRLVASGRSMDAVLAEWQGKSAEEILHEKIQVNQP